MEENHGKKSSGKSAPTALVQKDNKRNRRTPGDKPGRNRKATGKKLRNSTVERSNANTNKKRSGKNSRELDKGRTRSQARSRDQLREEGKLGTVSPPGRFDRRLDPALRKHLRKVSRCYSYLCHVARAYGCPQKSKRTDSFATRAAEGDRTLLHDCLTKVSRELEELAARVEKDIEPKSTQAMPGSQEKIEILRERFEQGKKLFADDDAAK